MSGYETSLGQMSIKRSGKGSSFSGFVSSTPLYYKNVINQLLGYWVLLDLKGKKISLSWCFDKMNTLILFKTEQSSDIQMDTCN